MDIYFNIIFLLFLANKLKKQKNYLFLLLYVRFYFVETLS